MKRIASLWLASLLGLGLAPLLAHGQALCGSPFAPTPSLQPQLQAGIPIQGNASIDCYMWQTFVYLTWPASSSNRGAPNTSAAYGAAGPVVWETYKPHDQVFLPNAATPAPWNSTALLASASQAARKRAPAIEGFQMRVLTSTSKVFRKHLVTNRLGATNGDNATLNEIEQVGGGVLYDQANQPVYYEMLLNETEFDFIVGNQLYNANTQYSFAQSKGLALPAGSIETKAAWKVLSTAEQQSGRFYSVQAIVGKNPTPVTMGLVGLHVFQKPSASAFYQGFWATFQQIDNAPLVGQTGNQNYSFNNPACPESSCPPNSRTTKPTQVVQNFGAAKEASPINAYMQGLIASAAPSSPWQYYQLIDVQWPTSSATYGSPAQLAPLPNGTPSTTTLINPVLETFLQKNGKSCLGCHTGASVASPSGVTNPQPFASSYSFLFGHAQTPAQALKKLQQKTKASVSVSAKETAQK